MATSIAVEPGAFENPLDALERIVSTNDWPFERNGDHEMAFAIGGSFSQYHLWFGWHREAGSLHLRCGYEFNVPERKFLEICEVLARINEQLAMGYFEISSAESVINFRYTVMTAGGHGVPQDTLETLVESSLAACERFYPAFMLALWGGRNPADAVAAAMLETVGEA